MARKFTNCVWETLDLKRTSVEFWLVVLRRLSGCGAGAEGYVPFFALEGKMENGASESTKYESSGDETSSQRLFC